MDHNGQKSVHMADVALVCNCTRPFLCAGMNMNMGAGLLRRAAVHSLIALMVLSFLLFLYGNKFVGSSVTENTSAAIWL